jgi:phosphoribosylamine--glycine ligase
MVLTAVRHCRRKARRPGGGFMKVLVVGGGGREHALVWKIRQSPLVREVLCTPGNAGIAPIARCVGLRADDVPGIVSLAAAERIDLTIVGPEGPLALGLVDQLHARGLRVLGPTAAAAEVETSKVFAKRLMNRHGIPTAPHAEFEDPEAALRHLETVGTPVVIKADGLAAGKGVTVCATIEQAREAIRRILIQRAFGEAGRRVILEQKLCGAEASHIVLTDGERFLPLASAKDHKALEDGDRGPNTGGMGVVSPAPALPEELQLRADHEIIAPTLSALAGEGRCFRGFLYAGLMISGGRCQVLEFNARLGDPEAQGILVRLRSDLVPALWAAAQGDLRGIALDWDPRPSVTLVAASAGYPGESQIGLRVDGLEEARDLPDVYVFHAGTHLRGEEVVTAAGRVLAVVALGDTVESAASLAYRAMGRIHFEGMHYRRDIGRASPLPPS